MILARSMVQNSCSATARFFLNKGRTQERAGRESPAYPLNPGHPCSLAVVAWRPKHHFFSSKRLPEHLEAKLWHKNDVFDEK